MDAILTLLQSETGQLVVMTLLQAIFAVPMVSKLRRGIEAKRQVIVSSSWATLLVVVANVAMVGIRALTGNTDYLASPESLMSFVYQVMAAVGVSTTGYSLNKARKS